MTGLSVASIHFLRSLTHMDQLIAYGSQFSSEAVKDLSPDQSLSCGQRRCHSTVRSFFYTLRIAPYRTTENSIRGLVITIIDSLSALAPPREQDPPPAL